MDSADEKFAKEDFAGALTAYREAHAIMRVPSTGIEVARTLDKLGKLTAALAAAREVVAMPATPDEPKPFTAAREQARTLVTSLEARVPTLAIKVKVAVYGTPVKITVDGKKLEAADIASPLTLEPGKYRVAATADGHTPASVEVILKERDRGQVALVLSKIADSPPPPTTTAPPPPPPSLSPLVPAGFTIAGVAALTGAITGALAISQANQANNNLCPLGNCPSAETRDKAQSLYDTADALAIGADVSFALALAGAALGIYGISVSLTPSKPAATPAPAAVTIGPGSASLRFSF
ncbi:MAG: hypothetical protein R3B70_11030 [Polyangiaceae bacterium]